MARNWRLGALGVTLICGILRLSNFAHGDTMAFAHDDHGFGDMVVPIHGHIFRSPSHRSFGPAPWYCGDGGAGPANGSRGVSILSRAKGEPGDLLTVSMGVMFVMNGVVRIIIGVDDQRFSDGERFIFSVREFKAATGLREGMALKTTQGLQVRSLKRRLL